MIGGCNRQFHVARLATGKAQAFERLRARHFMHQLQVDEDKVRSAVLTLADEMVVPYFLGQRCSHRMTSSVVSASSIIGILNPCRIPASQRRDAALCCSSSIVLQFSHIKLLHFT